MMTPEHREDCAVTPRNEAELVELLARTIRYVMLQQEQRALFPWNKLTDAAKEPYRDIARATIEAERKAGLAAGDLIGKE